MNIVLLESLGVSDETLCRYTQPLVRAGHTFTAYDRTDDIDTLIEEARGADVLMLANMPLPAQVIRACGNLRMIDVAFTGVDHVALDAAKEMGVAVCNASGYSTGAVAELTLCMMLALLRKVPQVEARCRAGGTKDGLVGRELSACTVGIVGTGAIGLRVAALCHALGCRVVAYSRTVRPDAPDYITYLPLEDMLHAADIVSLHCPLTDETRGMIGRARLAQMKPGAYLVNMARGPVVDSAALADALNSGALAGAACDVFETEPPLDAAHPLLHAENCIVTPHIAFASRESMELRAQIVFRNLDVWMQGGRENRIL